MNRAVSAAVLLLLLAACGRGLDEAAPGTTTSTSTTTTTTTLPQEEPTGDEPTAPLLVWTDPRYRRVVGEAAAAFTTATGIDVDVRAVPLEEMEQRVRTGRGPDLFAGNHTWLSRLGPPGLATELPFEARAPEFEPVAIDAFTFRESIRGVPYAMATIALFYNTALSPEAPGAFSQIKGICQELREGLVDETDETTTSTTQAPEELSPAVCVMVRADDVMAALSFLTAPGGYLYGVAGGAPDPNNVGLASEGAQAGAAFAAKQVGDGFLTAVPDTATMVEQFTSGEAVFLIGDLDLAAELRAADAPFQAAPLPIMSGEVPRPFVSVEGFMLAGRSRQAETAALFLTDYLAAAPTMEMLFNSSDGLPAYIATAQLVEPDQILSAFLLSAQGGQPLPAIPGIDQVLENLAPLLGELYGEDPDIEEILGRAAGVAGDLAAG